MKVLSIVESAYRATLEEQDDTILWLTHALKGAGADMSVLLRGNAVAYATRGQDAGGLAFGAYRQTQPPRLERDLAGLVAKGVPVYALAEDLERRGLREAPRVEGVQAIELHAVPALVEAHDRVWHW